MPQDDQDLPVLTDVIVAGLAWTPPETRPAAPPPPSPAAAALADAQQLLDELTVPWAQDPPAAPAPAGAPALVETEFDLGQSFDALASPFPTEAPPPGPALAFAAPDARDDDAPALADTPPPFTPEPPHPLQPDDSADAGAIAQAGDAPHAPQPGDQAIAAPADAVPAPAAAPAVDVGALEAALGAALDARLDAALRTVRVQMRADLAAQLRAALAPADQDPPT